MKQMFELDPEIIAFRTVTSLYAEEAFEHGVFRASLGALSGSYLGNLQAICEQDEVLSDRTRPSDSFKLAVGQLACIRKLPSILIDASHSAIEDFANEVLTPLQGPYFGELKDVFGNAPNRVEAFLIEQAIKQLETDDLFLGNPAQVVDAPDMFTRVLPEAEEHFRLFVGAARATLLSTKAREYLAGLKNEVGSRYAKLSPHFEANAHCSVIDWDDKDALVRIFQENHGTFKTDDYLDVWVDLDHVDDLSPESVKLTNDNTEQVGRQFEDLLAQFFKIRQPANV